MNPNVVIDVQNVSKRYRIGQNEDVKDTFIGQLESIIKSPLKNLGRLRQLTQFSTENDLSDTIWALKDISFDVQRGEVLGIIGRNGAGKSTLLKILSRITQPTTGRINLIGRVSSLLEVGTGFHPELTGRDNIFLNGTILGMSKGEIKQKFDQIVDFSGIEKFIDTPVKFYSSGMGVRLAFSVAAHLEPDILIIDEVLAVGDADFQRKCLGKMDDVSKEGRTILFVSHNMVAVDSLCKRVILIKNGEINAMGTPEEIIPMYLANGEGTNGANVDLADSVHEGSGKMKFTSWSVSDDVYGAGKLVSCNRGCEFRINYESESSAELKNVSVSMTIKDMYERPILTGATLFQNRDFASIPPSGTFTCRYDQLPLLPDVYKVHLWCSVNSDLSDKVTNAGTFTVVSDDIYNSGKMPERGKHGVILANYEWSITNESAN